MILLRMISEKSRKCQSFGSSFLNIDRMCVPNTSVNRFRAVKKYSQAAINRKRKFAQAAAPSELKLYDFISKKKDKKISKHGKSVC